MLYRLTFSGPAPGDEDGGLERLRAALEAEGLEVTVLRAEDGGENGPVVHVESTLEAPSAYHAAHVTGSDLFSRVFRVLGIEGGPMTLSAERAGDTAA